MAKFTKLSFCQLLMFQQILWDKLISPCMHYLRTCIQKHPVIKNCGKMANFNESPSLPVENIKKTMLGTQNPNLKANRKKLAKLTKLSFCQ